MRTFGQMTKGTLLVLFLDISGQGLNIIKGVTQRPFSLARPEVLGLRKRLVKRGTYGEDPEKEFKEKTLAFRFCLFHGGWGHDFSFLRRREQ